MQQLTLAAHERETQGKGAARKLRKANQLPAIFYGPNTEPIMLVLDYPEFERIRNLFSGENAILDLHITSSRGEETRKVMLKEVVTDPVKNTCLHADFYEISMDKEISVNIPIRLVNTPVGVTNGGLLQSVRRDLAITCLPDDLIDSVEIDVSKLDIGDSVHIEDIKLPEGIVCDEEGHLTVAVVSPPGAEAEEISEEEIEGEAVVSEADTAEGEKEE